MSSSHNVNKILTSISLFYVMFGLALSLSLTSAAFTTHSKISKAQNSSSSSGESESLQNSTKTEFTTFQNDPILAEESSPRKSVSDSEDSQSSASSQKRTRQIFNGDGADPSHVRRPPVISSEDQIEETGTKKQAEEFNGFPADFLLGLKPFQFQDDSEKGDASENTGFVDFPKEFSGLSTSLGGLKPFAPASTSSGSATTNNDDGGPTNERFPAQGELTEGLPHDEFSSQDPPIRSNIRLTPGLTENSEEKYTTFDGPVGPSRHRQTFNDHDNGFRHGPSEKAPSFRVAQDFSDFRDFSDISANLPTSKIKKLDGGATDNVTPSRSENKKLRRPSTSDNDFSGIIRDSPSPSSNAEPRNQFPSAFNGDSGGYGDSFIVQPFSYAKPSQVDDGRSTENLNTPDSQKTSEFSKSSSQEKVKSRYPEHNYFSSPSTTSSQSVPSTSSVSNFRDLNHLQLSEPQNIIPVAHFHNNPLSFQQFGGFRPIRAHGSATQGPSVRNFRQASHPRFFINNNDGNFDGNGFFDHSAVHGDFSDGPSRDLPNFNRPRGYNGPQFHFQRDHHPHRLHSHHQRPEPTRIQNDHRPHFHGDDTTSHHSSATHNILGSGNFGIIRGGIFADDDNPPQSFHPFNGHRGEGGDDFFHGFRDFQPFGGPLNNALSVNSQNIQNSGSKTNSVTAKVAISVSPESPATTTTPINRTTTSSNQSQNKIVPTPKRQNV